jgi:hypothetical protein
MVFNVDVKNSFSFFETESKFVDNFMALNSQDIEFNNRKVQLEVSNKKMKEGGSGEKRSYKGGFKGGDRHEGKRDRKGFGGFDKGFKKDKKKSFGKSRF